MNKAENLLVMLLLVLATLTVVEANRMKKLSELDLNSRGPDDHDFPDLSRIEIEDFAKEIAALKAKPVDRNLLKQIKAADMITTSLKKQGMT